MTARFFVNQQNTRGHRPRLQCAWQNVAQPDCPRQVLSLHDI